MYPRMTFLSWFVLVLAISGSFFFAWERGVPQAVYEGDVSMMTSAIGALFVGTVAYLGWQAWRAGDPPAYVGLDHWGRRLEEPVKIDFETGYHAAEWCLIIGVIGMAMGLIMQGKAIAAGGQAVFGFWATQLMATVVGCIACFILGIMTRALELGSRR